MKKQIKFLTLNSIRKKLLEGFFVLMPLGITMWLLKKFFQLLIGIFKGFLFWASGFLGLPEPSYWQEALFSLLVMCGLLFAVGAVVQNYVGRRIWGYLDVLILKIPGIKNIYRVLRQTADVVQDIDNKSFKEVVVVQWPSSDSRMLGFITNEVSSWVIDNKDEFVTVIIPASPFPGVNVVLVLHKSVVRPVNISVKDAFIWIVSCGAIEPCVVGSDS